MRDLNAFQRDVLRAVGELAGNQTKGLELKHHLEDSPSFDYTNVNHGRLYPNLNHLVDLGLVRKGRIDDRTNDYQLTPRGGREIRAQYTAWEQAWGHVADALDMDKDDGSS